MTRHNALFATLKDGEWHGHIELRELGGTYFTTRISELRKKLEGTKYEIIDRWSERNPGTKEYRLQPVGHPSDQPVGRRDSVPGRGSGVLPDLGTHPDPVPLVRQSVLLDHEKNVAEDIGLLQQYVPKEQNYEQLRIAVDNTRKFLEEKGIIRKKV